MDFNAFRGHGLADGGSVDKGHFEEPVIPGEGAIELNGASEMLDVDVNTIGKFNGVRGNVVGEGVAHRCNRELTGIALNLDRWLGCALSVGAFVVIIVDELWGNKTERAFVIIVQSGEPGGDEWSIECDGLGFVDFRFKLDLARLGFWVD